MKVVKSLLFASAAGMATIPGTQAADAPAQARPQEYVRICGLYGQGFFYIPGTDTCLKIGGFIRLQPEYNAGTGGIVVGSQQVAPQGRFTRDLTNNINYRMRGVMSWDARQQTEYGTLRTYLRAGWENTTPGATGGGTTATAFWDRAFIQFAGFTVGRSQSFFDVFSFSGTMSYLTVRTAADSFATGQNLWAYTAQFGNGLSGTISLEDPATTEFGTVDLTCAPFFPLNAAPAPDSAFALNGNPCAAPTAFGFRVPDIVANVRIDQAWGWAGISAVVHDASGAYWLTPNNVNNGHPADKLGWGVALGAAFNIGTMGDMLGFQVAYARGSSGQLTNSSWWQLYRNSNRLGIAYLADAVFGPTGSEVELTRVWHVNAAYQHFWSTKWRTSWYFGFVGVDYNDNATTLICANRAAGIPLFPAAQPAGFNCNPDFSFYQAGSRTQWNPVPQLDIGLEILYTKLNTAFKGPANFVANGSRPACINAAPGNGGCSVDDQGVWSAMFRWQRNFYP